MPSVGVLALQGDFREHLRVLARLGASGLPVRTESELERVDALIIPGGESTTIGKLADRFGLIEPLRSRIEAGMPVFGTCAGMIFLASSITEGWQHLLGVLDIVVARNAWGRQNESFEEDIEVSGFLEGPFPAVFIRAPWVAKLGDGVEVLATISGHPVMVRQGPILATSFHPELTGDDRIHQLLMDMI
jgi:5'-phosphate synthase pdxT subunit